MKKILCASAAFFTLLLTASAQNIRNNPNSNHGNKFEQLGTILQDANTYRTASGAPGHEYWQQRADYDIYAELDEKNRILHGKETVTYINNSPDVLRYIWLQLDENEHSPDGENNYFNGSKISDPVTTAELERLDTREFLKGYGVNILKVTDVNGNSLPFTINQTMMRIDLPTPLKASKSFSFKVEWNYKIPERMKIGGRGGFEHFDEDGNDLFTIAQWFPRLCVYSDYQGWNHKQFTGRGEFALPFGNYKVRMKVPADHIVAATGTCTNYSEVLSKDEYNRYKKAEDASEPVEITTVDQARTKEKSPVKDQFKIWNYTATNVRDFAWGSSRKFIWDAMAVEQDGKKVMCMSYYPKEAYALYRKYSTKTVAHTIRVYSKHTIPYPYPVAISVEAANGMEYPMICFNYGRTEPDGTYSERIKYGMISVIIHEVGHNFFPMIINSDERQWSWMDEGLNTFMQFLAEQEFDNNYPSSRGPAHKIVDYMKIDKNRLEPIMTNSENIDNFGANAYGKPATALNILRETIMGRELFDHAFREYSRRWAFKHPSPTDFFRTMEDASGVDLDWFWRAWFFDIEPVDISLDSVRVITVGKPSVMPKGEERSFTRKAPKPEFESISKYRNRLSGMKFLVDVDTTLRDFYYYYDATKEPAEKITWNDMEDMSMPDNETMKSLDGNFYYELQFTNKGGCVMPIILRWNFADGTSEIDRIHAYIWRKNEQKVTKTFVKKKEVVSIELDPWKETADIDESNNNWPKIQARSRFDVFIEKEKIRGTGNGNNPMQKARNKK